MRYQDIHQAVFLSRPNRFIAQVLLEGEERTVHVKNTGRCRELLVPGCTVYLEKSANSARKTAYDLVAVEKREEPDCPGGRTRLINMDSQAPNQVFGAWAAEGRFVPGLTLLRPETTWGRARFDFYWEAGERKGFVEVKGCTLELGGAAYFPDAPTLRGVKHVEELMAARAAGYEATLMIVIQMGNVHFWSPNDRTHPEFGAAVRRAAAAGVSIQARDCRVTPDSLTMGEPVEVRL